MMFRTRILLFCLGVPAYAGSSVPGIDNFFQVNEHVYRGAQPTTAGFQSLAKMGVKTILNLREADERASAERQIVTAAGMRYVNVPMTGLTPPTPAEISTIMALLEDDSSGPVFVHCKRGADRTGAVIAAYRIDHDHWDNNRALQEAVSLKMSMFQFPRKNFIRAFQPGLIEAKDENTLSHGAASPDPANSKMAVAAATAR